MLADRRYSGRPLNGGYQYITERPELDDRDDDEDQDDPDGVTIYATDPVPPGRERAVNVPIPDEDPDPADEPVDSPWIDPDATEQSTLGDWGAR